jgi:adenylate cyclase
MEADEEGTRVRLRSLQSELIDPRIAADGGRIVKTTGDGILVEFPSAVDAVRNALAIQTAMPGRDANLPEDRRIAIRVGINVGDVIVEGDDIHGDGVNVAARLEAMCEPGSVYVSGSVFEQVTGKLDAAFDDLGEQKVKNIKRPVRVYRVRMAGKEAVGVEAAEPPALELPDKPSIAVLPFDNMSGDPEQEYFSDGITEDIITGLSAFRSLFVIARNSTFTYKGKPVNVTQVARELGVRYVLEGSVRKAGNRVRITAQLIDASNGHHVWAERYDRDLDDVFAVQDEITERVVATVVPALDQAEQERAARKPPESLDTWDCYQRGLWHMNRRQLSEFPAAREYFRQAIRLAPRSPLGYCGLAYLGSREAMIAMHGPESDLLKEIDEAARTAVALDELDAMGHVVMGWSKLLMRETLLAIPEFERAVQLNPNHAPSLGGLAVTLTFAGRVDEGIRATETALRLSPRDPDRPFWQMTTAAGLFVTERYETALAELDVVLGQHPRWAVALTLRAANLSALGKLDQASALNERVHEILPNFKPSSAILVFPFMDDAFLDKLRVALEGADWEWR